MLIDTRDTVSATDLNREPARYIDAATEGRTLVVMRRNHPAAAIVPVERLSRIEDAEEDLRLLTIALIRSLTGSGERRSLDDVADELGVDLSDDEDTEE